MTHKMHFISFGLFLLTVSLLSPATELIGPSDNNTAYAKRFRHTYKRLIDMNMEALATESAGSADAKLILALRLKQQLKEEDVERYLLLLRQAVEAGNADAENQLALHYWKGDLLKEDDKRAIVLFKKSLANGNPLAMYNLGVLELEVGGDPSESISLMKQASKRGLDVADYWLGTIYLYGEYIPPEYSTAITYLQRAAKTYGQASTRLGEALVISSNSVDTSNSDRGVSILQERSHDADPEASLILGRVFSGKHKDKYHVAADIERALQYFNLARDQGSPTAIVDLIRLKLELATTANDRADAISVQNTASKREAPWAWDELGFLYAKGELVKRDDTLATNYFRKASVAGNPSAMYNLSLMLSSGRGRALSKNEAKEWLEKAASLHHSGAAHLLRDK